MKKTNCLFCYQTLDNNQIDYHPDCSKKMFGSKNPPEVLFSYSDLLNLANNLIYSKTTITGVQAKLSLDFKKAINDGGINRLTIVGLNGQFILKPQSDFYASLPEIEDLTMHLAELSSIKTVPHSLIKLQNGSLAYITKRIDRIKNQKLHMEDMCQLTERLTEHKYRGSYEQIANTILKYSNLPILDLTSFFELLIFSFLTGNNDMHFKNFSLIEKAGIGFCLSPAYDLVASSLVVEGDDEEMALNLNGKKRKLKRSDFDSLFEHFKIPQKTMLSTYSKFSKVIPLWIKFVDQSFLEVDLKNSYKELIQIRANRLQLV